MDDNQKNKTHHLELINQKRCHMTGVVEVKEFEPTQIQIILEEATLCIKGTGLHVDKLNLAQQELELQGEFASLQYGKRHQLSKSGKSLLKRMMS